MKRNSSDIITKWKLEGLWWLTTIVLVALVISPIYLNLNDNYPFYTANILYIIVFVTLTRYIFLLKHTVFSHTLWIKAILIFLPIPIFLYCIDSMYDFQRFLDEEGLISIMDKLTAEKQSNLSKYIKYEKLFFGAGAIITLIMLPIRMIISIWRVKNRDSV